MKKLFLILFCTVALLKLTGQSPIQPDSSLLAAAQSNASIAKELFNKAKFDAAEEALLSAIDSYESLHMEESIVLSKILLGKIWIRQGKFSEALQLSLGIEEPLTTFGYSEKEEMSDVMNNIGSAFDNLAQYEESLRYYERCFDILKALYGEGHIKTAGITINIGINYYRRKEFVKAAEFYKRGLAIREENLGKEDASLINPLSLLGSCYSNLGAFSLAEENFLRAQSLAERHYGSMDFRTGSILMNLGGVYQDIYDFERAIEYRQKALVAYIASRGEDYYMVPDCYYNLGLGYIHLKKNESAKRCFNKAIELYSKQRDGKNVVLGNCYKSLGDCYRDPENDSALWLFKKSIDVLSQNENQQEYLANAYISLGDYHRGNNDFDNSLGAYMKAIDLLEALFGKKHKFTSDAYYLVGLLYRHQGNLSMAVEYFKLSIESLGCQTSDWKDCTSNSLIVDPLRETIETYLEIGKKQDEYIQMAWSLTPKIVGLIREIRNNYNFALTSPTFAETAVRAFGAAIHAAATVKENEKAFIYSEQAKSIGLLFAITNSQVKRFSNVPDSILQLEHELDLSITELEKKEDSNTTLSPNETELALESRLFDLRRKLENLKVVIRSHVPDYYRLKYDLSTTSLAYVQDTLLSPNQTLLEFFVGDSSIFIFTVGKGKYNVMEVKKDFPLEDWVKQLQEGLYGYYGKKASEQSDALYRKCMLQYMEAAQKLHDKLIVPVQDQLTADLVIVPDGILGYVPFEALLKGKPAQANNFATYPFLVKDYHISYCYSATLLREMKEKRHKQEPKRSFVAFAPFYEGSYEKAESTVDIRFDTLANGQDTVIFSDVVTRKEFKALPASGEETATAAKLWKGDYFLNSDATEQRFNAVAGDYRIVHLSTHGIADARVGDYSYLAFAEQKDSIENEFLYVRDLYNTQLNADLVVLSACETAQGELQRGEGIISLARAFAYAGAKSIVTTLWTVDDSASKDLTKEFYLQLKKGKKKDAALQAAKLKLVNGKDAKRQHPFFWAGFIGVGDMSPMK